ncbi:hypothetical protein NDU88_010880, partial [Pleurodeles waltl]
AQAAAAPTLWLPDYSTTLWIREGHCLQLSPRWTHIHQSTGEAFEDLLQGMARSTAEFILPEVQQ